MSKPRIVILACEGITTSLLVESLGSNAEILEVFIEERESKSTILKRRLKKISLFKLIGQLCFLIFALPFIPKRKKRISEIIEEHGFTENYKFAFTNIITVQNKELISKISAYNPDLIVINGTRILKKAFIENCTCPIVNIHVGITPKYRGIHGGFWAIHNNDLSNFGVTLHYVDAGIDTGRIIAQERFKPLESDNYNTFPILQYCAGLNLLERHLTSIIKKELQEVENIPSESHLYYHPTLMQYIFGKAK